MANKDKPMQRLNGPHFPAFDKVRAASIGATLRDMHKVQSPHEIPQEWETLLLRLR